MEDSSNESDETEWEEEIENEAVDDVGMLPEFANDCSEDTSSSKPKSIEILVPKGRVRKRQNFYDKAVAALEKEQRIQVHKVHLLCLVAHAMITSRLCNHQLVQSLMVSMVPSSLALVDHTAVTDTNMLSRLLKWFSSNIDSLLGILQEYSDQLDDMVQMFYDVLLFVSLLRGLGIRTRVVLSLKAAPYRPLSKTTKPKKRLSTSSEQSLSSTQCDSKMDAMPGPSSASGKKKRNNKRNLKKMQNESPVNQTRSPYFKNNRSTSTSTVESGSNPVPSTGEESCGSGGPKPKKPKHSDSMETASAAHIEKEDEKKGSQLLYDNTSSWVEVHMANRWVCLHIPSVTVNQPSICEKQCPYKLDYIIGIDNNGCISDVTGRYSSQWCTTVLKSRVDQKWWVNVLRPYAPPTEECELEEEDVSGILMSRPLPTNMSEYKGHPLYVLKRHLTKFEVIYPEDTEILGHFKNEPVYSRSSVYTLHTRETWLKEARLVRRNEKPFKVVKGRKRKGQSSLEAESNTAEIFGLWQTEEYIPPPVVDGKVTRNEFGNIELFKPSMLPAGAIHLNVAGIGKVARKLNIDYAPAMMGWNHCGRHCRPIIEGIVVAEEYRETLMEAWSQEQQIIIEKDIKKKSKRAASRWVKLTKGLIIRERVKKRFSLSEEFSAINE